MESKIILFSNSHTIESIGGDHLSTYNELMQLEPKNISIDDLFNKIIDEYYVDLKTDRVIKIDSNKYQPNKNIFLINENVVIAIHHRSKTSFETLYIRLLITISILQKYNYEQTLHGIYSNGKLYLISIPNVNSNRLWNMFNKFNTKQLGRFNLKSYDGDDD